MSEEKHHHGLFQHKKETPVLVEDGGDYSSSTVNYEKIEKEQQYKKHVKEEKHHKRMGHLGEIGTAAATAIALHEKHEAKKDPEHAHRHKLKEKIAEAAAVGGG
ncbi:hypothetical protein GIB67_042883, partial [Kingdonia uniflora]